MATIWVNGVPQQVAVGTRLSAVLSDTPHPCSGKGVCGKCRVRAAGELSPLSTAEERHLTAFEIADDVRLSCCTTIQGNCRVTVATEQPMFICTDGARFAATTAPAFAAFGVAVDIGTTTLAARLYDTYGHLLATAGEKNPQIAYGADVLSRVDAAGQGSDLVTPLRTAVNGLLSRLATEADIDPFRIDGLVITGNTAMLCFFTATDPAALARAPFALPRAFGETLTAGELGLTAVSPTTSVYLPPCASAFVGADALCAALACDVGVDGRTAMLADMGTNGEMLLYHDDVLYACSTAAGPAFEGVGISCGMPAVTGAVDEVLCVGTHMLVHVIGRAKPQGICGSGLVDAAACLLALEEMDGSGCIGADRVPLAAGITLTQEDIRALQQAKAAVSAGLQTLLHRADLPADGVEVLYTAGGFGSRLNGHNAAAIGLIPRDLATRIRPVGNAALDGAAQLLLDDSACKRITALAANTRTIELASDPYFADLFIEEMNF